MALSAPPAFAQRWHRATTAAGDRPFLVREGSDGAARQWSYSEFGELASDVTVFLASRGVQRGDAVHVALSNSPAFVAVWLPATPPGPGERLAVMFTSGTTRGPAAALSRHMPRCAARDG
jgi:crotonobetaine/carnitine-CoA ligase